MNVAITSPEAPVAPANEAEVAPNGSITVHETSDPYDPAVATTTSTGIPSQRSTVTVPAEPEANVPDPTTTPFCTKLYAHPFHPSPYESTISNVNVHVLAASQTFVVNANGPTQVLVFPLPQSDCT